MEEIIDFFDLDLDEEEFTQNVDNMENVYNSIKKIMFENGGNLNTRLLLDKNKDKNVLGVIHFEGKNYGVKLFSVSNTDLVWYFLDGYNWVETNPMDLEKVFSMTDEGEILSDIFPSEKNNIEHLFDLDDPNFMNSIMNYDQYEGPSEVEDEKKKLASKIEKENPELDMINYDEDEDISLSGGNWSSLAENLKSVYQKLLQISSEKDYQQLKKITENDENSFIITRNLSLVDSTFKNFQRLFEVLVIDLIDEEPVDTGTSLTPDGYYLNPKRVLEIKMGITETAIIKKNLEDKKYHKLGKLTIINFMEFENIKELYSFLFSEGYKLKGINTFEYTQLMNFFSDGWSVWNIMKDIYSSDSILGKVFKEFRNMLEMQAMKLQSKNKELRKLMRGELEKLTIMGFETDFNKIEDSDVSDFLYYNYKNKIGINRVPNNSNYRTEVGHAIKHWIKNNNTGDGKTRVVDDKWSSITNFPFIQFKPEPKIGLSKRDILEFWATMISSFGKNQYCSDLASLCNYAVELLDREGDQLFDNKVSMTNEDRSRVMKGRYTLDLIKFNKAYKPKTDTIHLLNGNTVTIGTENGPLNRVEKTSGVGVKKRVNEVRIESFHKKVFKNYLLSINPPIDMKVKGMKQKLNWSFPGKFKFKDENNFKDYLNYLPMNTSQKHFTQKEINAIMLSRPNPVRNCRYSESVPSAMEEMFKYWLDYTSDQLDLESKIKELIGSDVGCDSDWANMLKRTTLNQCVEVIKNMISRRMWNAIENIQQWASDMLHITGMASAEGSYQFVFNGKRSLTIILPHNSLKDSDSSIPYIVVWLESNKSELNFGDGVRYPRSGFLYNSKYAINSDTCIYFSKPHRINKSSLSMLKIIREKILLNTITGILDSSNGQSEEELLFHFVLKSFVHACQKQDVHLSLAFIRYINQNSAALISDSAGFIREKMSVVMKSPLCCYFISRMFWAALNYREEIEKSFSVSVEKYVDDYSVVERMVNDLSVTSCFFNRKIDYKGMVEEMFLYAGTNKDMLLKYHGFLKEVKELLEMNLDAKDALRRKLIGKNDWRSLSSKVIFGETKNFSFSNDFIFSAGEVLFEEIRKMNPSFQIRPPSFLFEDVLSLSSNKASIPFPENVYSGKNRGKVYTSVLLHKKIGLDTSLEVILHYIEGFVPISRLEMKIQYGAKRHFHVMTFPTRVCAKLIEDIFHQIASSIPYETITKSAEFKPRELHDMRKNHSEFARRNNCRTFMLSKDATKWAPSSVMFQYYVLHSALRNLYEDPELCLMVEFIILRWMSGFVLTPEDILWKTINPLTNMPYDRNLGDDWSFRMGVFGKLSSVYHVSCILYGFKIYKNYLRHVFKDNALQIINLIKFDFRVSSDDSFVMITLPKLYEDSEAGKKFSEYLLSLYINVMDYVEKMMNIKTQKKKSFVSDVFGEYNSNFIAAQEVRLPMTIQLNSSLSGITGRGYPYDCLSLMMRSAELHRRGLGGQSSYSVMRILVRWVRNLYGVNKYFPDKINDMDIPIELFGVPDTLPTLLLLGSQMNNARILTNCSNHKVRNIMSQTSKFINSEPIAGIDKFGDTMTIMPLVPIKITSKAKDRNETLNSILDSFKTDTVFTEKQKHLFQHYVPLNKGNASVYAYSLFLKKRAFRESLSPKAFRDIMMRVAKARKSGFYLLDTSDKEIIDKYKLIFSNYEPEIQRKIGTNGKIKLRLKEMIPFLLNSDPNDKNIDVLPTQSEYYRQIRQFDVDILNRGAYRKTRRSYPSTPNLQIENVRFKTPLALALYRFIFGPEESYKELGKYTPDQLEDDNNLLSTLFRLPDNLDEEKKLKYMDLLMYQINLSYKKRNMFFGSAPKASNVFEFIRLTISFDFYERRIVHIDRIASKAIKTPLGKYQYLIGNYDREKSDGMINIILRISFWVVRYWCNGSPSFASVREGFKSALTIKQYNEISNYLQELTLKNVENYNYKERCNICLVVQSLLGRDITYLIIPELSRFKYYTISQQYREPDSEWEGEGVVIGRVGRYGKFIWRIIGDDDKLIVNGVSAGLAIKLLEDIRKTQSINHKQIRPQKLSVYEHIKTEKYKLLKKVGVEYVWDYAVPGDHVITNIMLSRREVRWPDLQGVIKIDNDYLKQGSTNYFLSPSDFDFTFNYIFKTTYYIHKQKKEKVKIANAVRFNNLYRKYPVYFYNKDELNNYVPSQGFTLGQAIFNEIDTVINKDLEMTVRGEKKVMTPLEFNLASDEGFDPKKLILNVKYSPKSNKLEENSFISYIKMISKMRDKNSKNGVLTNNLVPILYSPVINIFSVYRLRDIINHSNKGNIEFKQCMIRGLLSMVKYRNSTEDEIAGLKNYDELSYALFFVINCSFRSVPDRIPEEFGDIKSDKPIRRNIGEDLEDSYWNRYDWFLTLWNQCVEGTFKSVRNEGSSSRIILYPIPKRLKGSANGSLWEYLYNDNYIDQSDKETVSALYDWFKLRYTNLFYEDNERL